MTVFVSHLVYPRWTAGVFPEWIVNVLRQSGIDAVIVFFVLSGYVIAYKIDVKDKTFGSYAFSRATRIYSVVIPAIILTYLFDQAGMALNPADYEGWWYADHSFSSLLTRGLTFSNEFWRWPFRMGSNGPYWSLSYEIWYYVLFGTLVFYRGWARIALTFAISLLVGSGILLLAPIWAFGVLLYAASRRGLFSQPANSSTLWLGSVAAFTPIVIYILMRATEADTAMTAASHTVLRPLRYLGGVGYAATFLWLWTVGALIGVHFAGVALLTQSIERFRLQAIATLVRWLAGASFSIYIIHYPTLQAIDAVLMGARGDLVRALILAMLSLMVCFVFASLFERRLGALRKLLRRMKAAVRAPKSL